jgi:hypothetical protein
MGLRRTRAVSGSMTGDDWLAGVAVRDALGDALVRARRVVAERVSGQDWP